MTTAMVFQLRARDDRKRSVEIRAQAEAAVRRIEEAAERIKRMTQIYQERLDGTRRGE